MVISGQPTLRTLNGERQLEEGEVVAFPLGRSGAYRIDNRGEQPVRVLIVSTMIAPEVNEFPDSGKVWARTFPPGAPRPEEAVDIFVRPEDERADYFDGEA